MIAAIYARNEHNEEDPPMAKRKPSETHQVFKKIHKALADLETWVTAAQAEFATWLRAHEKERKTKKRAK